MRTDAASLADRPLVLETAVFVSAGIGMVLELAGSRLMSPYFGSSLFVWTSLIGVILAFMSLGNYVGGRLADRWVDATMLSWVLGIAALGVALMSFSEDRLLPALVAGGATRTMSVVAACLLFAVPSMLLGVVTPYSIRVRMHGVEHAGATVGSLYALATLGSIAGTFAAGFWLISVLGTHNIMLVCVVVLAGLAVVLMGRFDWRKALLLAAVLGMVLLSWLASRSGTVSLDTQYDRYLLRTAADPDTGRELIGLSRDHISAESASYVDSGEPYAFDYYGYYDLAARLTPGIERALMVGGGTFSYPRIFVATNANATVDAVEIDGELVDVAREYFGFSDDPRIRVFLEDGRTFLNRAEGPYGAVFIDAFKSEATVPYQLTTVEAWRRCYDLLAEDGILVMNVVASPTDERSRFYDALFASISAVFPQVEAYAVQGLEADAPLRNTSIVAVKRPGSDLAAAIEAVAPEFAANRFTGYEVPQGTRLLTDDFAPVDQYLMRL
ncbi:MAG: fused MFS/spermidine synthase [Coriobacteriia bacterium]|nr:fused MFS/spermidine synthase [Coriobacteriia bacterium]